MHRQRKQYTAAFKAKVALEAIKGQRTVQELGSSYGVHPSQITNWKKQLVAEATEIFAAGRVHANDADEHEKAELYEQIGRLQMELDWLQKKSGILRR
jgi:transposase